MYDGGYNRKQAVGDFALKTRSGTPGKGLIYCGSARVMVAEWKPEGQQFPGEFLEELNDG